ncbi:DUF805 domain-containing protein [Sphingomonas sp. BK580]|uniref:DUF805 domain-containing protein n=1 Tax=Sphingomonas sp. BK580 TaxID=2586972 RepID=UPI00161ED2BA|nr:DUF805 domain-containing protein [Sphingomonas sp. BK580]MBB3695061.1 uncharacterized membrane protein YhaH (DUF805 family) [Sphingomonas sp. BK580]
MDEWVRPWRLYADFDGRATRRDYWFFHLGAAGAVVATATLARLPEDSLAWLIAAMRLGESNAAALLLFGIMLMPLVALPALLVPSLAVSARRLRDLDRSPRWLLLLALPFGGVALLALLGLARGVAVDGSGAGAVRFRRRGPSRVRRARAPFRLSQDDGGGGAT